MKPQLALAFVVATAPALAQSTGVSHPPDAAVDNLPMVTAPVRVKPSAAIPVSPGMPAAVAPSTTPDTEFQTYQPYNGPASNSSIAPYTAPTATLHSRSAETDADAGIVTEVPHHPNELAMGTALRARLRAAIETQTTEKFTPFTAVLSDDIQEGNRVAIPAGSIVEGIVTQIRGGKRFRGAALIHLQAQRVILPDGSSIPLQAQVVDTDQTAETKIDSEGNIIRKDHPKEMAAVFTLATGTGAVAGALIGGGVGAIVGAGIGAGISTAIWLKQDRQARLPQDTLLTFSLTDAMDLRPEPGFVKTPQAQLSVPMASAPVHEPAYAPQQSFVPTN